MRLAQRLVDVGDVAQAEGDRVAVERAVGKRQGLGIARRPGEALQQPAVGGARSRPTASMAGLMSHTVTSGLSPCTA